MAKIKFFSLLGYAIPLIIFLLTAVLLYYGLDHDPRHVPSPLINTPVPAFQVPALGNSHEHLTEKIFLGHISLLNVWASWCESCKQEHSQLLKIAKTKQVVLIGLNYKDTQSAALHWLAKAGNPYFKVLDDAQGNLGINLGVYGTPETYLIDSEGIIRYKYIGPITQIVWDEIIAPQIRKIH
jgi:cytochrome c biogenesis protein CcmG/thiol:disulfide interchange protein DsbE